tara:strand:- start:425 stop:664 length:240 start_codon:yes stop_codon:yes gene_type:complete
MIKCQQVNAKFKPGDTVRFIIAESQISDKDYAIILNVRRVSHEKKYAVKVYYLLTNERYGGRHIYDNLSSEDFELISRA